jgi:hypothetical protein
MSGYRIQAGAVGLVVQATDRSWWFCCFSRPTGQFRTGFATAIAVQHNGHKLSQAVPCYRCPLPTGPTDTALLKAKLVAPRTSSMMQSYAAAAAGTVELRLQLPCPQAPCPVTSFCCFGAPSPSGPQPAPHHNRHPTSLNNRVQSKGRARN